MPSGETLESYGAAAHTDWFPNGVDATFFKPDAEGYDEDSLSFIGRMDYYPNQECMLEFCAKTFPLVRAKRPQAKLLIVGADPSPEIRRGGRAARRNGDRVGPRRTPVHPAFGRHGGAAQHRQGTQNKIPEAMAMGVPVVTSPMGAGGVDALDEEHFLVGRTPEEYAHHALRIMGNPEERGRLARAGRERMLTNHDWSASMRRLDGIVERCIEAFHRERGPVAA